MHGSFIKKISQYCSVIFGNEKEGMERKENIENEYFNITYLIFINVNIILNSSENSNSFVLL